LEQANPVAEATDAESDAEDDPISDVSSDEEEAIRPARSVWKKGADMWRVAWAAETLGAGRGRGRDRHYLVGWSDTYGVPRRIMKKRRREASSCTEEHRYGQRGPPTFHMRWRPTSVTRRRLSPALKAFVDQ
jgi:hypothetical protein